MHFRLARTFSIFFCCRDRIDLPIAEDAFSSQSEAQEIIEDYNEDEELKWREKHKIRVREQKQREAAERHERERLEAKEDTNIMDILERAELMEELENELEELNVMDDEHMQQHLQSNSTNSLINGNESDNNEDFDDDIIPDEFQQINDAAANMSIEAKLKFYENHLRKIGEYLSTRKFTKFEDLKELAEKRAVQECLRNAIDEIAEEKATDKCEEMCESIGSVSEDGSPSDAVCTLSPPDGRKCPTVAEFKQLEESYMQRGKSVALVIYKSQLRSVMKSIASCSKDAHADHMTEKRELYEYLNDSIDRLRAEIILEKQAKLEEKFVDDDTDNEAPADDEDDLDIDIDDEMDYNGPSIVDSNANNADTTVGVSSTDSMMISPTKRRICFAAKPSVTTYHLDDEPWRVQNSTGEPDETINHLMDETFQFFNSPGSSSSSSVCDYDGHDEVVVKCDDATTNSTNKCDEAGVETNSNTMNSSCEDNDDDESNRLESISQETPSASKTLYYKDGSTLYLKFAHTATPPQQPSPVALPTVNAITSPIDIYKKFSGEAVAATVTPAVDYDAEKQKLKDYVMQVANLNTDELHQKMSSYLAGKTASSSLPNGHQASPTPKTTTAEPIKSILKNCEAVKREVRGKIYEQIEDDGKPSTNMKWHPAIFFFKSTYILFIVSFLGPTQNFYTQYKCDPFVGFDQVSDIVLTHN